MTKEEKINRAIEIVGNIYPEKIGHVYGLLDQCGEHTLVGYVSYLRKFLGNKSVNRASLSYWEKRFWPEELAKFKSSEYTKNRKRGLSPFTKEFYLVKGYSEEESEFLRKSNNPTNKEFYIKRGFTEEESIKKSIYRKEENLKKATKTNMKRIKKKYQKNTTIEYYLSRGYDKEEARKMLAERQKTFSKKICIKKYGEEEGLRIWKERQDRWVATLNRKSDSEKAEINSKKSNKTYENLINKFNSNRDKIKEYVFNTFGMNLYGTVEELEEAIAEKIAYNRFIVYHLPDRFYGCFAKLVWDFLEIDFNSAEFNRLHKKYCPNSGQTFLRDTNIKSYCLDVEEGYLRSSVEISCYQFLKEKDIQFELSKAYENSNFRSDFYFPVFKSHVEICPRYGYDEKYTKKMEYKKKVFSAILVKDFVEFKNYVERLYGL